MIKTSMIGDTKMQIERRGDAEGNEKKLKQYGVKVLSFTTAKVVSSRHQGPETINPLQRSCEPLVGWDFLSCPCAERTRKWGE